MNEDVEMKTVDIRRSVVTASLERRVLNLGTQLYSVRPSETIFNDV